MPDDPALEPHEDEHWVRRDIDIAALTTSILDGTHPAVAARLGKPVLAKEPAEPGC